MQVSHIRPEPDIEYEANNRYCSKQGINNHVQRHLPNEARFGTEPIGLMNEANAQERCDHITGNRDDPDKRITSDMDPRQRNAELRVQLNCGFFQILKSPDILLVGSVIGGGYWKAHTLDYAEL